VQKITIALGAGEEICKFWGQISKLFTIQWGAQIFSTRNQL